MAHARSVGTDRKTRLPARVASKARDECRYHRAVDRRRANCTYTARKPCFDTAGNRLFDHNQESRGERLRRRSRAIPILFEYLNSGMALALRFAVLLFGKSGSHPGLLRDRLFPEALYATGMKA